MRHVAFPFRVRGRWDTSIASDREHLRHLIEQVLFTTPGERVHRPEFGSGLTSLLFAPAGELTATAAQVTVQSSLQHWLGDLIVVEAVEVILLGERIEILVQFVDRRSGERSAERFRAEV